MSGQHRAPAGRRGPHSRGRHRLGRCQRAPWQPVDPVRAASGVLPPVASMVAVGVLLLSGLTAALGTVVPSPPVRTAAVVAPVPAAPPAVCRAGWEGQGRG